MRRREFLTLTAASIGGVLVYSLDREVFRLSAQADKSIRIPLRFFSQAEALIVAAAASRIIPSDEAGPGAREAGVVIYIDRQLAGPYGRDRYRYTQGPFEDGPPELGYQGKATPREIYREGLKDLVVPDSVKATWGHEWKKAALHYFDRTFVISFDGEHLAYRTNYVDLDPVYKDSLGDPLLRLTMNWQENERKMAEFATAKAVEIGRAMGAKDIAPFSGLRDCDATRYQSTHVQGGAIMGASPNQSVVNSYLQHWQAANLFVLGASAFPQNASANPTLTLLALVLRTADAIVNRYLKNPSVLA
jgi:choline dehydrogenase-like flavoprotein